MYGKGKLIWGIILGLVGAAAIFCITVGIGCAVNGLTFGQQVCEWFGTNAPVIEETVEQVADAVSQTPMV